MKKTLSFAAVHFTVAFSLGYLLTGSLLVGGAMALLEPTLNTVAFYWHERAWDRWGRGERRLVNAVRA
jgi:uncharacterized membrane protein